MMRGWRVWIALWAGWTGLALFIAVGASLTYVSTGRPGSWRLTIAMQLGEWWVWAALTPLVVWLARRWPLRSFWPPTPILVHLATGAVLAFLKTALDRRVRGLITGFMPYFLISTVTFQFIIYWVIVAVIHAVDGIRRERERERRAAQLETSLAEARLELLRAQLHPHFLFNTLNAIAEFVHESPATADRLIGALGDLLREATNGRQQIALAAELDLLRRYVEIQQARFEDRLELRIDADRDALAAMVPSFLLQPIVENSIRHGLAGSSGGAAAGTVAGASAGLGAGAAAGASAGPVAGAAAGPVASAAAGVAASLAVPSGGTITIEARRAGDRLRIEVRDTGAGLPDAGAREGFGLGGTRARLQALYGDRARVDVRNADGAGVRVTIEMPMMPAAPVQPLAVEPSGDGADAAANPDRR
jgi:two-component system LytT family sensor kinase